MSKYSVINSFTLDELYLPGDVVELGDKTAKDLLSWGDIVRYEEPMPQPEIRATKKKVAPSKEDSLGDRSPSES